jgi:hypothetical protein
MEWLELAARLVTETKDMDTIRSVLNTSLQEKLFGNRETPRGSIEKTVTILLQIWANVPRELALLRDTGMELLQELPSGEHLPIHWGMSMAAYPFFASVAAVVGRLLKLQGTATAAQVQRRLREQYGERETVSRSVRHVLRTFFDWQVLGEGGSEGLYISRGFRTVARPEVEAWMIEAFLHANPQGSHPLKEVLLSPCFFPFRFDREAGGHRIAKSGRIEVIRQGGLADDMVMLSRPGTKYLDK